MARTVYQPYYNSEGYPDPTAYKAIQNCTHNIGSGYMPLTLLYTTVHAADENILRDGSCFALKNNRIPIAPQLICSGCFYRESKVNQVKARQIALILLTKCRELWILGTEDDAFVSRLIDEAVRNGIQVRFYSTDFREVRNV